MTPNFTATIKALTQADSLVPITRSQVMRPTMANAGRLKTMGIGPRCGAEARSPGSCSAARRSVTSHRGMVTPKPLSNESKYPAQPMATATLPTAYSRIRSQPMIHAMSSPRVEYA